jgi:hypothetical protein
MDMYADLYQVIKIGRYGDLDLAIIMFRYRGHYLAYIIGR